MNNSSWKQNEEILVAMTLSEQEILDVWENPGIRAASTNGQ